MTRTATRRRVVVTGLGAVSAWGWSLADLRRGADSGRTAIGAFARFPNDAFATRIAAEVPPDPAPDRGGRSGSARRTSFADRFAVAAAAEALASAGLPGDLSPTGAGVFFASSTGGMYESEGFYAELRERPRERVALAALAAQEVSGPGDAVARAFRATGPVETISSACASASLALGVALDEIRSGTIDVALAGGSDSLCRITYGGFNALRAVDPVPCAPFRARRAGMSLGEGAAVLVLESAESARARGAEPLAELLGAGATGDAHHMTAPHPEGEGAARAIEAALADAGIPASAVDFVNAHGTGTPLNDVAEYRALRRVFGERVVELPVAATKASIGHLLGAAGAIEAVATVTALVDGAIPGTPGDGDLDPDTPVLLVRERTSAPVRVGVSVNLAFGGCNGALVFARTDRT